MAPKKRYKTGALPRLPLDVLSLTGDAAARASVVPHGVTVVQTAASSASSSARLASTLALTNKVTTTSTHTDDNNKQSAVSNREDALVSAPSRRFDKSIALRAAENDEEKKRALEELERDVSSSSTKPTICFRPGHPVGALLYIIIGGFFIECPPYAVRARSGGRLRMGHGSLAWTRQGESGCVLLPKPHEECPPYAVRARSGGAYKRAKVLRTPKAVGNATGPW